MNNKYNSTRGLISALSRLVCSAGHDQRSLELPLSNRLERFRHRIDPKSVFLDYLAHIIAGPNNRSTVTAIVHVRYLDKVQLHVETNSDWFRWVEPFVKELEIWLRRTVNGVNTTSDDKKMLEAFQRNCEVRIKADRQRFKEDYEYFCEQIKLLTEIDRYYSQHLKIRDALEKLYKVCADEEASLNAVMGVAHRLHEVCSSADRLRTAPLSGFYYLQQILIGIAKLCMPKLALDYFTLWAKECLETPEFRFVLPFRDVRAHTPKFGTGSLEACEQLLNGLNLRAEDRKMVTQSMRNSDQKAHCVHAEMLLLEKFRGRRADAWPKGESEIFPYIGCSKLMCCLCAVAITNDGYFEFLWSHFRFCYSWDLAEHLQSEAIGEEATHLLARAFGERGLISRPRQVRQVWPPSIGRDGNSHPLFDADDYSLPLSKSSEPSKAVKACHSSPTKHYKSKQSLKGR